MGTIMTMLCGTPRYIGHVFAILGTITAVRCIAGTRLAIIFIFIFIFILVILVIIAVISSPGLAGSTPTTPGCYTSCPF